MIVYLGAAIDTSLGSPADQFNELGNLVIKAAGEERSVIIFNPLTAFMNAHAITHEQDMQFLINTNNAALDAADLAVFSWTNSPSMGVPLEISRRKDKKTHMIVWNRTPKKLGIYLRQGLATNQLIVDSVEELADALANFFRMPSCGPRLSPKHKTEPLPEPTINGQEHKKTFMLKEKVLP
jgi:hypothetical protein